LIRTRCRWRRSRAPRWRRPRRRRHRRLRETGGRYHPRSNLLSRGEAAFFGPLQEAVASRFLIMCKVRLADIITCSKTDWSRGWGGAIAQKHIDFVLCDAATTRFILAIELDDRSHDRPHRRRRDAFVDHVMADAGVRLIRFQAQAHYSVPTLTRSIGHALSTRVSSPWAATSQPSDRRDLVIQDRVAHSDVECRERPRLRTDPAGGVEHGGCRSAAQRPSSSGTPVCEPQRRRPNTAEKSSPNQEPLRSMEPK